MEAGSGVRSMDKKASIATNMSRTPVLIQRHLKGFKHVQTIRYENSIYGKAKKKNRRLFFTPFVLSILFNDSNKYFTDVNCYIYMWQQIFGYGNCLQELSPVGRGRDVCFDCFGLDRQHTEHKHHLQRVNALTDYTVLALDHILSKPAERKITLILSNFKKNFKFR